LQRKVDRGNRVWRDLLKFEILRTGADVGVAAQLPGAHHIGEIEGAFAISSRSAAAKAGTPTIVVS
jgi:hypothetical protein